MKTIIMKNGSKIAFSNRDHGLRASTPISKYVTLINAEDVENLDEVFGNENDQ